MLHSIWLKPWSSLVEGDEGCNHPSGKLLCLWHIWLVVHLLLLKSYILNSVTVKNLILYTKWFRHQSDIIVMPFCLCPLRYSNPRPSIFIKPHSPLMSLIGVINAHGPSPQPVIYFTARFFSFFVLFTFYFNLHPTYLSNHLPTYLPIKLARYLSIYI